MRSAALILSLAVAACQAPEPAGAPSVPPPAASATEGAAPSAAAPATQAAPADRWARPLPAEPDPQAKALYRAAMARLAKGDHVGARPLIAQIRRDHPDSRFAARLSAAGGKAGGPIALLAAVAGLLAGAAK